MGTVLHFNRPLQTSAPLAEGDRPLECQVVIFPGVRIERHELSADTSPSRPSGRTNRDGGSRPRKSS